MFVNRSRLALMNWGLIVLAAAVVAVLVIVVSSGKLRVVEVVAFLAVLLLVPFGIASFLRSAQLRMIIYVVGALLVMQSESGIAAVLKPLYLPAASACVAVAIWNVRKLDPVRRKAFRLAFRGGWLLLTVTVLISVGSVVGGEELSRVVRDALTYLMIAGAPFVGADAARTVKPRRADRTSAVIAGIAATGFAIFWLSNRGVSTLETERLVMFSMVLTGFGLMLGIVYGIVRRSPLWLAFGVFCFIAIIVTGTRTGFGLVLGFVGAMGLARNRRIPPMKLAAGGALAGLGTYLTLPFISSYISQDGFLESRINSLHLLLEDGVSADQSGVIRQRALDFTLDIWSEHPLAGVGFGHLFPNPNPNEPPADFQLDSAALILAKFGIIGSTAILLAVLFMAVSIWQFHKVTGVRTEAQTVGRAFTVMCLALMPLASPMEDKGFALAFTLVFYLIGAHSVRTAKSTAPMTAGGSRKLSIR